MYCFDTHRTQWCCWRRSWCPLVVLRTSRAACCGPYGMSPTPIFDRCKLFPRFFLFSLVSLYHSDTDLTQWSCWRRSWHPLVVSATSREASHCYRLATIYRGSPQGFRPNRDARKLIQRHDLLSVADAIESRRRFSVRVLSGRAPARGTTRSFYRKRQNQKHLRKTFPAS